MTIVAAASALSLFLCALPLNGADAALTSSDVFAPVYGAQSRLAIKVTCDGEGATSRDPTISLLATNEGSANVPIHVLPMYILVDVTLKDASGATVPRGTEISGRYGIMADYVLKPGESLHLSDWVLGRGKPLTTHFPLSYFGYHNLATGAYTVTASSTAPAVSDLSSQCVAEVR